MNIETFLAHHHLTENPFGAEEARHDPVFSRLIDRSPAHPDFDKILGKIDEPSAAVVFGEKGSGKTAIRLLIGKRVSEHNARHLDRRTLLVAYDDLNPVLDRVAQQRLKQREYRDNGEDRLLERFRLEDHQDAILSLATTRLVDALLEQSHPSDESVQLPATIKEQIKKMPRQLRHDALGLAMLYDQPRSGSALARWRLLRTKLRLGWAPPISVLRVLATVATVTAVVLTAARYLMEDPPHDFVPITAIVIALSLWAGWGWQQFTLWRFCRRIQREMPAIERSPRSLQLMMSELPRTVRQSHPWPVPGVDRREARYRLTQQLLAVLEAFGYSSLMVLVDRVDEPTLITGKPQRMRPVVWPMLDNKFLQQQRVGIKLLLPIELRHLLYREDAGFFQEARLDKQNMIDRLTWSGAVLYDLCSLRLTACRKSGTNPIMLTDLFEVGVSRQMLIDALDQMQQPRDAFKFLYAVLLEHCRMVPEDQATFRIPRLVLDAARRDQARRIQDMQRGFAPA